jgi:hypothetical protein
MTSLSAGGGLPFMLKRKQSWIRWVSVSTRLFLARYWGYSG